MKTASFFKDLIFSEEKPVVKLQLETTFTKEIRIAMKAGQVMREHQTPYSIVVQIVKGKIDFGVEGQMLCLNHGDIISLEGGVSHNLTALEESVVRLTLSTADEVGRLQQVADSEKV